MRQRINAAAVCSSANYTASKRAHLEMLKRNHSSVSLMSFSSEKTDWHPTHKTIMVFGKPMVISYDEYQSHNLKELGF